MRLAWLLSLALLTGACRPGEVAATPEGAYRAFSDALQRGDTKRAWRSLSPDSRRKVEERSKAIASASKGAVRDEPELLLFQATPRPRAGSVTEVSRVRADEGTAVLSVTSAEGTREVKLVRDSGTWFVDLTEALEGRAP